MDPSATLLCGQCGQKNRSTDRFCNHCGVVLTPPSASHRAADAKRIPTAPPAPQPPVLKCVVGHAIATGAHFCAHGHPIALDALHLTRGSVPAMHAASPPPPIAALTPMPRSDARLSAAQPVIMTPVSPMQAYVPAPPPAAAPVVAAAVVAPATAPAPQAPQAPREPRMLRGFLVPLQGRPTQEYWAMHGNAVSVGRANTGDEVDIAVLDSTTSSRHATIHFDTARGVVFVEDLGSTNGTFVNDVPIGHNGRRELRDNDRVRFGGFSALMKLLPLV